MANKNLEFAGDYDLQYVYISNHKGQGRTHSLRGENITQMIVELNIYEGIYKSSITGSMVIADTTNLIGNLPIQGTERIFFKLNNKLTNNSYANTLDFTEKGGHPLHVYKVTDRKQLNDTTQTYTIHFASREFVRNQRVKVSECFSGRIDEAVYSIFQRPEYLDSKKKLYFQKSRNQDKVVVPNVTPFDAIQMLSKRAMPDSFRDSGVGYLFFETPRGFHFRSWESLCIGKNGKPREIKQKFRYVQVPVDRFGHEVLDEKGEPLDKVVEGYRNVESYEFKNNFHDVAANTALGTYAHTVITHNIFDKSYKKDKYHYHNSFQSTGHVDNNGGYGKESSYTSSNPMIVETPVDYDVVDGDTRQKGVSDFAESRISVVPTTQFLHNEETGSYGVDVAQDGVLEGERISLKNQLHSGTRLQMTVKGQAWLQAGDLIQFDVQTVENRDNARSPLDPQLSGRYVISSIRHRIAGDQYRQVLECIKDSSPKPYGIGRKSYAEIAGEEKSPSTPSDIDYT